MKHLKVAIVGCGRISSCYRDAFERFDDFVDVAYAVDKNMDAARNFAENFPGCKPVADFSEILDKGLDVVCICTPHYLHAPMAIQAMEAGIHVLTEKPIATNLKDAENMISVSRETGKKLGVIFQTRYTKSCDEIKRIIQSGEIGRIKAARSYLTWDRDINYYDGSDWKGTWEFEGGGVLIDQAIHSIDRVRWLIGSNVQWIDGAIYNRVNNFVKVEDTADALIMFENGCKYNLYACNCYSSNPPILIEIEGEKGRVGLNQDMGYVEIGEQRREIKEAYEDVVVGPSYWGSSHHLQIKDFFDSVINDMPVSIDGEEGRKTLEIVRGIYKSSQEKKRVYLPFEDIAISEII